MHPRLGTKARTAGGHLGHVKNPEALWADLDLRRPARSGEGTDAEAIRPKRLDAGVTRRFEGFNLTESMEQSIGSEYKSSSWLRSVSCVTTGETRRSLPISQEIPRDP